MQTISFTLAYWCVLAAALMPIVCAGIAKSGKLGQARSQGGFDNHDPRAWLASQTAWRARANAALANSFEALPFFIGAVVIAHQLSAPQGTVDALAASFIALRVVYTVLYIKGIANLRTAVWMAGYVTNIAILFAGYR